MYAENCQYKLDKMAKTGSRKGQRQPTIEEVKAAKVGLSGFRLQVRPVKNQFSRFFTVTLSERFIPWVYCLFVEFYTMQIDTPSLGNIIENTI